MPKFTTPIKSNPQERKAPDAPNTNSKQLLFTPEGEGVSLFEGGAAQRAAFNVYIKANMPQTSLNSSFLAAANE